MPKTGQISNIFPFRKGCRMRGKIDICEKCSLTSRLGLTAKTLRILAMDLQNSMICRKFYFEKAPQST